MARVVNAERKSLALEIVDIHKSFFNNYVLKGVSLDIEKGQVLGLVGSNGAGKSTLMKIVNGVYKSDKGHIVIDGTKETYSSPVGAKKSGIAMVYQELSLIPTLSVAENIFLGIELKKYGFIQEKLCMQEAKKALDRFNLEIEPNTRVEDLSIGNQQMVEIVKSLMHNPSVLILDEPTASLTTKEINLLFELIDNLKKQGIAIFLISHHMQEILNICNKIVVLRNGEVVLQESINHVSIQSIVQAMIGRKLAENTFIAPAKPIQRTEPLLVIHNISFRDRITNISFHLYPGEVLGIAGLMGSGRTEILKCIYGLFKPDRGEVILKGNPVQAGKVWEAIERGVFLVPENRHRNGIIGIHNILDNMILPILHRIKKYLFLNTRIAIEKSLQMKEKLNLKATGLEQDVQFLSGGNQQKVVFAKGLLTEPTVLLLDEPTAGIDVEAKSEIAQFIRGITDANNGVIIVSSEMEEMERICDRVLVLNKGKMVHELIRDKGDIVSEESLAEAIQGNV